LRLRGRRRGARSAGFARRGEHMGVGLVGRTLGSLGIGNVGAELFRLAKPFDMRFIAHDPVAARGDHARKGTPACQAKQHAGAVADRRDSAAEHEAERAEAKNAAVNTVDAVLNDFLERHVRKLHSADEIERVFDKYVRPKMGAKAKSIYELRRGDIVAMLDAIVNSRAPVMADRTLAHVRKALKLACRAR
jgi:D-isomer specific 2-hydroxyacid dehydrogenase, NAD binding domain